MRVKPGRKHERIQKESCDKLGSDRTTNGQLLGFMRKKIRAQSNRRDALSESKSPNV